LQISFSEWHQSFFAAVAFSLRISFQNYFLSKFNLENSLSDKFEISPSCFNFPQMKTSIFKGWGI